MSGGLRGARGARERRASAARAAARGAAAVAALVGVVLAPGAAEASALTASAMTPLFATLNVAATLTVVVFAIAALVARFAPTKRNEIKRTVLFLVLYLGAFGGAYLAGVAGKASWGVVATTAAELLGFITVVNLAALALFDLLLPRMRMPVPSIFADIAVGAGYVVAVLATMRRGGVDFSGIVATSAVVTGILALSLQATLGNVVGGIALQGDKSLRVGDWLHLESGKEGRIREIRWRYTVLETRDADLMIVPNSVLLGATLTVMGKRDAGLAHRMWVHFNVDFRYAPADVIHAVEDALRAAPIEGVAEKPPPDCICLDLASNGRDSFAHYAVRYYLTDLLRNDPTSSRVRVRIFSALKRARIPLAVPAATLFVEQEGAEKEARKKKRETERRRLALSRVDFLKVLRDEELRQMAEDLQYAPFAAGETITKQGEVAHWLYLLTNGTVEVRVGSGGEERKVIEIEAPGVFGEMGLMTGEPRSATVVAKTEAECYRLDKPHFEAIIQERPELAAEISSLLAQRKVALQAAREDLDAAQKQRRVEAEKRRILGTIQVFFGMNETIPPPSRRPS